MGLRGLLFARTWVPSPMYMSSEEELEAERRSRTRRYEKWYSWARYSVVGIVIVILLVAVAAIISIYVNGEANSNDYEYQDDGILILTVDKPTDSMLMARDSPTLDGGGGGGGNRTLSRAVRTHPADDSEPGARSSESVHGLKMQEESTALPYSASSTDNIYEEAYSNNGTMATAGDFDLLLDPEFYEPDKGNSSLSRKERHYNHGRQEPPISFASGYYMSPGYRRNHPQSQSHNNNPGRSYNQSLSHQGRGGLGPEQQLGSEDIQARYDPHFNHGPPFHPQPPQQGNNPHPWQMMGPPGLQRGSGMHPPQNNNKPLPPFEPSPPRPLQPLEHPPQQRPPSLDPLLSPQRPPLPQSEPYLPQRFPPLEPPPLRPLPPMQDAHPQQSQYHPDSMAPSPMILPPALPPSTTFPPPSVHPIIPSDPPPTYNLSAPAGLMSQSEIQHRHSDDTGEYYTPEHEIDCGFKCVKDENCIAKELRCDGRVNCNDGSDERNCECLDRIGYKKQCDGFQDCPDGEDEFSCYGCPSTEFSCRDPSENQVSGHQCLEESQYCDGTSDCSNGRDERECFRLVSMDKSERGILSEGVLQKNMGRKWYYVCKHSESEYMINAVATKVCNQIIGDLGDEEPSVKYVPATSPDFSNLDYVYMGASDANFKICEESCPEKQVISIKCPEPACGYPVSKYEYSGVSRSRGGIISESAPSHSPHSSGEHSHGHSRAKKNKYSDDDELQGKVVGGYDSKAGEYPFLAAIYRNGTFHCGCSIVSDSWVVTAAHCTHYFERWTFEVQVGQMRRYSWSPAEQTRMVTEVHPHERYDKKIFMNDIAMMKLDRPLHLSKWVTTTCLPDDRSMDPTLEQSCTVVGWGDLTEDGNAPDNVQEVSLPIKTCKETFTRESVQLCAGVEEGGKDACQGDSGGPFLCQDMNGRYILNGVVSFGRGCARPGQLGVYTRVSSYYKWIFSIISGTNPVLDKADYYPKYCPEHRCLRSGGECIFEKMSCDQNVDCMYGDDELGCSYATNLVPSVYEIDPGAIEEVKVATHVHEEHAHETGGTIICHDTMEYQCKTSKLCVPANKRCDGNLDCSDHTDEKDCDCPTIVDNAHKDKKCDGISHCSDAGDEEGCEYCSGGDLDQVPCRLSPGECIARARLCDGTAHCSYGEDEVDCFRISKDKSEAPGEGFLDDKKSRGASTGYVYIRQGNVTWKPACSEDYGKKVDDLICPYLGLGLPGSSKNFKRNAPHYVQRPSRKRAIGKSKSKDETDEAPCTKIKVSCGEPSCGDSRLYAYSTGRTRPAYDQIGAQPWTATVLVEGETKCLGTIVSKKWVVASKECIERNLPSLKDSYVVVRSGPYYYPEFKLTTPMEQVKRVNYIDSSYESLSFLHLDKSISFDQFSASICSNLGESPNIILNSVDCVKVSLVNYTLSYTSIGITECDSTGELCALLNKKNCQTSAESAVYCTLDEYSVNSWYFVGFLSSTEASRDCSKRSNQVELINPFYGRTTSEKYQDLISNPAQSVVPPPKCEGTRCSSGNCVGKTFLCDKISHCSDGMDESRCESHYQIFRASETENYLLEEYEGNSQGMGSCPTGHFRCDSTYNCIPISSFCDGKYDCGPDDLTDEPEGKCDCKNYIQLIAPEKICDPQGFPDCPDRSDEKSCPCHSWSFYCDASYNMSSNNCIHPNLVCDGQRDCRSGRDEMDCVALSTTLDLLTPNRTADHYSGFVLLQVKNAWHPYCSNDWSQDLASALCKKEFGFNRLIRIMQYDLEEIKELQRQAQGRATEDDDDEEEEEYVKQDENSKQLMIWDPDEDLLGKYSNRKGDENYEGCAVAYIICGN